MTQERISAFRPIVNLDREIEAAHAPSHPLGYTGALMDAIYQSALRTDPFWRLQTQLLAHFREDRSQDDTPLTRSILQHIKRALRLGAARAAMEREQRQVQEVIDALAPPVVVIDGERRVLGLNREADNLLRRRAPEGSTVLHVAQGQLHCREPGLLAALMAQADEHSCASMHLDHGDDRLLAYLYKNPAAHGQATATAYSLVLIDRQRGIRQSIDTLAQRVGLTPREIEVVELSLQGLDAQAISTQARISLHTVRQHVKNIYDKTGVHNQNALFALVLQNIVLAQAGRSHDARLLPHITGLAHSRLLPLADGRQLSYAEYGAANGRPVLYFHALNASRLELLMLSGQLRDLGIRLIAWDRPGFGHSSFVERHDYREYTPDVLALLDALDLERVDLLSASAGTAHALHTAWALPTRVRSVNCTAVVPPIDYILASKSATTLNGLMNQFFRVVPSLMRPAMELALLGQTVDSLLALMSTGRDRHTFSLGDTDLAFIKDPLNLPYFVASMIESLRQGARAWAMESALVNRRWSIDPAQVRAPVRLWHGGNDGLVPDDMVAAFARAMPQARLELLERDTHLLVFRNLERVVAALHPETTKPPQREATVA